VETKQIERLLKKLGKSFFLSRTFDLEIYSDEGELKSRERVLPRSVSSSLSFFLLQALTGNPS
jgi:hypothetical protein